MKTFLNAIKKYFVDFGTAVAKGDIWCKLSLLVMGAVKSPEFMDVM